MKTVLSVQDLSCVGRCSLTVALPVLSAMGCRCSVLPTAVLSTHTGFPDPHVISLTEHIPSIHKHFDSLDLAFDVISTGYMADPDQIEKVMPLLQSHKTKGSTIIVDPAMGDHGKLYSRLDEDHVLAMSELCKEADILLPNLTEAALLADMPYRENTDGAYLRALTAALMEYYKVTAVVITGVTGAKGTIGFCGTHREEGSFSYQSPVIPRQFHGTGDLFAAVFAGSIARGALVYDSGVLAADFVRCCVENTPEVSPHGVAFESQLFRLWNQNYEKNG